MLRPFQSRGTPPGRAALPFLLPLARIAHERHTARIRYRLASGEITEREISVLGLGWRRDGWFLSALCGLRASYRLMRVDRVLSLTPTNRPAPPRPPRFDARIFALADLRNPRHAPTRLVSIRLDRQKAELAPVLLPFALVELAPNGDALCHFRATALEQVAALIVSLRGVASSAGPTELDRLVESLQAERAAR